VRIGITGGPRCAKSTLARELSGGTIPIRCTDPFELVKDREDGVEYVPDTHQEWSKASEYVATDFLNRPGPWILDGVGLPRALRKWRDAHPGEKAPLDQLIVLMQPVVPVKPGQLAMAKGVKTVLDEITPWLGAIVETRGRPKDRNAPGENPIGDILIFLT